MANEKGLPGVVRDKVGKIKSRFELTEKQSLFVYYYSNGIPRIEAQTMAGYTDRPTESYRLLRNPNVDRALKEQIRVSARDAYGLAVRRVHKYLEENDDVPMRSLLEIIKTLGGKVLTDAGREEESSQSKTMEEMTREELESALQRVRPAHDGCAARSSPDGIGLARAHAPMRPCARARAHASAQRRAPGEGGGRARALNIDDRPRKFFGWRKKLSVLSPSPKSDPSPMMAAATSGIL